MSSKAIQSNGNKKYYQGLKTLNKPIRCKYN